MLIENFVFLWLRILGFHLLEVKEKSIRIRKQQFKYILQNHSREEQILSSSDDSKLYFRLPEIEITFAFNSEVVSRNNKFCHPDKNKKGISEVVFLFTKTPSLCLLAEKNMLPMVTDF